MELRHVEEEVFKMIGLMSISAVLFCLIVMTITVVAKGLPALSITMITKTPESGYYLGGGGGILNAIVGSIYLASGATVLALIVSLPIAVYLQSEYFGKTKTAGLVRVTLDILWGIPSIVYGAFGFVLMIYLGMRASLICGMVSLALVILPIMSRSIDEMLLTIPQHLKEVSYAAGATRLETTINVTLKQAAPGILTGIVLAFGRAIGDAASILFTAGYTDQLPTSLLEPAASLPLAIFLQFGTPYVEVQNRAYASAVILLAMILLLTTLARLIGRVSQRNIIR